MTVLIRPGMAASQHPAIILGVITVRDAEHRPEAEGNKKRDHTQGDNFSL
jgi:hypothetical protein